MNKNCSFMTSNNVCLRKTTKLKKHKHFYKISYVNGNYSLGNDFIYLDAFGRLNLVNLKRISTFFFHKLIHTTILFYRASVLMLFIYTHIRVCTVHTYFIYIWHKILCVMKMIFRINLSMGLFFHFII